MQQIYYELGILTKAIQFKNLSSAAMHVGLSQPQLSRIVAKIEDELKIVILDRAAKRKSGWTAVAHQLAALFLKSSQKLALELKNISHNQLTEELHIGTLEGLSNFAIDTCRLCFDHVGVPKVFIEIYDLNELEAHFMSGDLDLIFTSRGPGRQKFKYELELGYQILEKIETNSNYSVLSHFEYGRLTKRTEQALNFKHTLISNSLAIRKHWFSQVGGNGYLPTEAKKGKPKEHEPVLLIGSELLNPNLWNQIAMVPTTTAPGPVSGNGA